MKITKDMTIGEIIRTNPNAAQILMGFGMGCIGCPASQARNSGRGIPSSRNGYQQTGRCIKSEPIIQKFLLI